MIKENEITEEQRKNIIEVFGSIEEAKINQARVFLKNTDYISNKIIEYQFIGKPLDRDYQDILNQREEAREIIRKYENK